MSVTMTSTLSIKTKLGKLREIPTIAQKKMIGAIGVDGIKANFKGNPLGWRANRKSTIAAKGHSQINVNSGDMRDDTAFRITGDSVEFVNKNPHAIFAEKGTKPHIIQAKGRGVLAFTGDDGDTHFARTVRHPGTPARKFMTIRPAVRQKIITVLRQAINDAFTAKAGTVGPLGKGL